MMSSVCKGGIERGHREALDLSASVAEWRLGRALHPEERVTLARRLGELGGRRLAEQMLSLSPEELSRWLAEGEAA